MTMIGVKIKHKKRKIMSKSNTQFIPLKVTVKVTQEHINKGKVQNENSCPIALALKEQGFKGVAVPGGTFTLKVGKFHPSYTLPKKADQFVDTFDYEGKVKPFEFTAELYEVEEPNSYDY